MCGRLVNFTDAEHLAALFDVADLGPLPALRPSYNLPPVPRLYAITGADTGHRAMSVKRWAFVPAWWAKSFGEALKPSNARGETVACSPLFRDSFRSRRCLIPVDAFYEWRQADKVPHVFRPVVGGVFALGGLWDVWTDTEAGERRDTFAVITTGPNTVTAPIHDRMPVILPRVDWSRRLDPATP